jgi:hypothetical protein
MTGTLHQTVQGEITKQYSINIDKQEIKTRSTQYQSNPEKSDTIRPVKNIAVMIRRTLFASIITFTVLLIAQNIAVIILESGRGVDNCLVL